MDTSNRIRLWTRIGILSRIVRWMPLRLARLINHLFFIKIFRTNIPVRSIKDWVTDLPFYIIDVVGGPELYQLGVSMIRPRMRYLTFKEYDIVASFYNRLLTKDMVWINDRENWLTKNMAHAFVGCSIVHFQKAIKDHILIHEMVHVLQFYRYGSVYINRAVRAQLSDRTYDYGGVYGLQEAHQMGKAYSAFNFEQQAQIIEDYYRILQRSSSLTSPKVLDIYKSYFDMMKQDLSMK